MSVNLCLILRPLKYKILNPSLERILLAEPREKFTFNPSYKLISKSLPIALGKKNISKLTEK